MLSLICPSPASKVGPVPLGRHTILRWSSVVWPLTARQAGAKS